MNDALQIERNGAVLTLWLNRPELHNAFDAGLIARLTAALEAAGRDDTVRTVLVAGHGASFSAGADMQWMRGMATASEADNREDALALARLKAGEILSPSSTRWLMTVMEASRTGKYRLRGAVPPGWSFGHKTGTGQDLGGRTAGYNDVGILTAPDGKSYSIAVMIGDTPRPIKERQELMQGVVAAVVAQHR